MAGSLDQVADDMAALSGLQQRFATSEGERVMLHAVRERLPEGAIPRVEGFVSPPSPAAVMLTHVGLIAVAALLGIFEPAWALPLTALLTVSLVGEAQGRFALVRGLFPRAPSYNLVVDLPTPEPMGTVVICTALDLPRFRRPRARWQTPSLRPMRLVLGASGLLTALQVLRFFGEPLGELTVQIYYGSLGLFLLACVLAAASFRRDEVGADEATGPTALLELTRRLKAQPAPGINVIIAFTGCGHAFQSGLTSLLKSRREQMVKPVLVVDLEQPGTVPLRAVAEEGSALSQPHRATGPALVERLRWAGVSLPIVRRYGATDARAALVLGFRALALSGGPGRATVESVQRSCDVIETLVRWYAHDVAMVAGDRTALQEVAQALRDIQKAARIKRDKAPDTQPPSGHDEGKSEDTP